MDLKLQKGSRGQAAKRPPPRADPAGAGGAEGELRAQPWPTAVADKGWGGPEGPEIRRPPLGARELWGASSRPAVQPQRGAGLGDVGQPGHEARGMARASSRAIPLAACPGGRCRPSSVAAAPSRGSVGLPHCTPQVGDAPQHTAVWAGCPHGAVAAGDIAAAVRPGLTPRAGSGARARGQRCDPWHRALVWGRAPATPTRLAQTRSPQEQPLQASTSHGPDSRVRKRSGRPQKQRSSN